MATNTTTDDRRELAVRAGNGIAVSLYWSKATNRVTVEVFDDCLAGGFEFDVDGRDALAAFHHPYAYAANRLNGCHNGERTSINA